MNQNGRQSLNTSEEGSSVLNDATLTITVLAKGYSYILGEVSYLGSPSLRRHAFISLVF